MGEWKKTYSFRFDQKLMTEIQKCADNDNRTLSNFVETVLKKYVEKTEKEKTEC